MKNYCIFAASDQDRFISMICGGYFYGYTDAAYQKDIRLSIHNGLLHSCFNRSWSTSGKIAFPLLYILIFHSMTKTNENASKAKHSSLTSTPTERNTVSIEAFNVEMNAKNKVYYFILSNGLFDRFAEFCKNYHSDDPHWDCIKYLLSNESGKRLFPKFRKKYRWSPRNRKFI